MLDIIILAAGKGTRMQSQLPKVLHPIAGKPLLAHVLDAAQSLQQQEKRFHLILGHGSNLVREHFSDTSDYQWIEQEQQLGTGHAVMQSLPHLRQHAIALILYGDVPLIQSQTLARLLNRVDQHTLGLLTVSLSNPCGYGRIVRNPHGAVSAIVEHKDATAEQLVINEVNTGIMALPTAYLQEWLPQLSNENAQGEYYLTDIIAMAVAEGVAIATEQPGHAWEVLGINDRKQQMQVERRYQHNQANHIMRQGVTLLDAERFDCRGQLSCGKDVVIDINCVFEGNVSLGNGTSIGPNCYLKSVHIGDNTHIKANTVMEDAIVGSHCELGPFARIRPGSKLADKSKIGNFVETKKVSIGEGSKINHLSYIGDAELGAEVNVGAGTITCNYDGANKHKTTIGDRVFVGSNTALVAPVSIADEATLGAGSVITRSVEKGNLALSRPTQKTISDWQRPVKK